MALLYRGGCLLPFLIIFNLFFGRLFFSPKAWLITEGVLILVFFVYSYILSRKLMAGVKSAGRRGDVIDVEGEVVSDKEKLE